MEIKASDFTARTPNIRKNTRVVKTRNEVLSGSSNCTKNTESMQDRVDKQRHNRKLNTHSIAKSCDDLKKNLKGQVLTLYTNEATNNNNDKNLNVITLYIVK
ncbi:uncharacterized protein LOC123538396 [Mercenaria mercenaria]|uniref:uncharacterized protein LOC123538396 n=1 Tax=Mercenaria mercenaria TaxID=6596 RepID=UPI00234EEA9B|nr:uncharacterized protein LOC123538396 [Mercenaria mercenaria]